MAARLAANYLSRELKSDIQIGSLRISDGLSVRLTNVLVNDPRNKPLFKSDEIFLSIRSVPSSSFIHLHKITLKNTYFGLHRYKDDGTLNLDFLTSYFQGDTTIRDTSSSKPMHLLLDQLEISNTVFAMQDEARMEASPGIDYNDMLVSQINMKARNISFSGDTIQARINELTCREKSGFKLKEFSGNALVSSTNMTIKDLIIKTGLSSIDLDFSFDYPDFNAYTDFLDSVYIKGDIRQSLLNLKDIGYFAPELLVMDDPVEFSGQVEGTVTDFKAKDFIFDLGKSTHFDGDVSIKGLPDIYTTYAKLDIRTLDVSNEDINNFALPIPEVYLQLPEQLDGFGTAHIEGNYAGVYNDFQADLNVDSEIGNVAVNMEMRKDEDLKTTLYHGEVKARNFYLGKILKQPDIGHFSIETEFEGRGLTAESLDMNINGWIDSLEYKGNVYDKIILGGDLKARMFQGRFVIMDSLLYMGFEGLIDLNKALPKFDFETTVYDAFPYRMHIADRSNDMELKMKMKVDFKGIDPDSFVGSIHIDSLNYLENGIHYELNHFDLNRSRNKGQPDIISVRSDYVDADLQGNFQVKHLIPAVDEFIKSYGGDYQLSANDTIPVQTIEYQLKFKDIDPITRLFFPDLEISPGAVVRGKFDSGGNRIFTINGNIDDLNYSGLLAKNFTFVGNATSGGLNIKVGSSQFLLRGEDMSDSLALGLENLSLNGNLAGDSLIYKLEWNDQDTNDYNTGSIGGFMLFPESKRIEASITDANAIVNGDPWSVKSGNYVIIDSNYISIRNISILGKNENFSINGAVSENPGDTLYFSFKNWMLSNFKLAIAVSDLDLEGKIDGQMGISNIYHVPEILADLQIVNLNINKVALGDAYLKSHWNNADSSMMLVAGINKKGDGETFKTLDLQGEYYPFDKKKNFDIEANFRNFNIAFGSSFLSSFSSVLNGLATGRLDLNGTIDKPLLTGKLTLQRAEMKVDYLNTKYSFAGDVEFEKDKIRFDDIVLYDSLTNRALCSGSLNHHYFKDMSIDLTVKPDNLLVMNIQRYQNDIFYGKAFATGTVHIFGPFDDLSLDIDAKTNKGTSMFIPINYSVDITQADYIIFTNNKDTTSKVPDYRVQIKGLHLNIDLEVTRDAEVQIYLPSEMGFIKANGDGHLRMGLDPRGYLTLYGKYVIYSGLFNFTLEQLVSKRFDIIEGSQIKWEGDLYKADVNISARYRLKTSLDGLGISMFDPSSKGQKVQVYCIIRLSDNLFNPNMRFSIVFPYLNEQTKQTIYAVLDTTDVALMNQQAISLLVLSTFSYTGGSSANPISSLSLLSNTLSNLLSQISNKVDIGINYIPGDNVSSEEIEVALSTQLFNDRLIIDGNFDVSSNNNNTTQKTSSIVGDVNIEYKLTPDGRYRVKAFNRSNDISIIQNYAPYTQGLSVFYRREFDHFSDLFKRKNPKKNKPKLEVKPEPDSDDPGAN